MRAKTILARAATPPLPLSKPRLSPPPQPVRALQPDSCLLSLCSGFLRHLHACLLRSGLLHSDPVVSSELLLAYSRIRLLLPSARAVFSRRIPCRNHPLAFNILVAELSKAGLPHLSLQFFLRMRSSCAPIDEFTLPPALRSCAMVGSAAAGMSLHGLAVKMGIDRNLFVASALVLCYTGLSKISCARRLFDEMPVRDAVLWTSMLSGYAQTGEPESALVFFGRMAREGIQLDGVVMVSLLLACGKLGWLRHGRSVHGCCIRRCFGLPLTLGNALIDMYVKCGEFICAERVYGVMPKRDVISFSALILGHGLNGRADAALKLFEEMRMEGVEPNSVTFLGVLSACGHAGMVEKAWAFFNMMKQCELEPELKHYASMVDALAKAGQLVEAERFVQKMPLEPDEALLGALLSGCRLHGNMEVGERVSRRLMRMCPGKSGYFMSLVNLYTDAGRFSDAEKVREFMKQMDVGKLPGFSSIELDGSQCILQPT